MKLSDRGPYVQRCSECSDPEKRLAWGCDGPTANDEAMVLIPCFVCGGQNDNCDVCEGQGEIQVRDCPNRLVQADHKHAIDSAVQLETGLLPAPGAWHDQSATFVQAFPLLLSELQAHRERASKKAQEKANRRRK